MAANEANMKLEPCDVFFGVRNVDKVTCVADVAASLQDTHFDFETVDLDGTVSQFRPYFDVDNAGTPPAAGGRTLVEVDISSGDSASVVAAALEAALEAAVSGAQFKADGADVYIYNNSIGAMTAAADVDTGFTFANDSAGSKEDLGGTSGGVEVSPSVETVEVTADQFGSTILDEIMVAHNVEVTMSLLEMTASRWESIIGNIVGDKLTPAGGTQLVGYGETKRFQNMSSYARELVLKPVNQVDNSRNLNFWKSYPLPESINYSGDDLQVMSITFRAIRDTSKNTKINIFAFGDGSQDVVA